MIHIFLPGGIAHQESFDPKPYAPIEYRGELGTIATKIPGEVFCETLPQDRSDRRQDHGHSFDVARRGGPRARHAQHVHRLSAQPGARSFRAWAAWSATNTARATTCRRTFAFPNEPNEFAGTGYLSSSYGPFSLGADPANKGFKVRDLSLPGRHR